MIKDNLGKERLTYPDDPSKRETKAEPSAELMEESFLRSWKNVTIMEESYNHGRILLTIKEESYYLVL